jgi:hypothetical protein
VTERCAVAECDRPGKHRLGLRCRVMREPSPVPGKAKTHALWLAESDAYLCDAHALGGLDVTLLIEANATGAVCLRALSGGAAPRADKGPQGGPVVARRPDRAAGRGPTRPPAPPPKRRRVSPRQLRPERLDLGERDYEADVASLAPEAEVEVEHLVATAAIPMHADFGALHAGALEFADEPHRIGTLRTLIFTIRVVRVYASAGSTSNTPPSRTSGLDDGTHVHNPEPAPVAGRERLAQAPGARCRHEHADVAIVSASRSTYRNMRSTLRSAARSSVPAVACQGGAARVRPRRPLCCGWGAWVFSSAVSASGDQTAAVTQTNTE